MPGERSVAGFDEDALTLAVDASLCALGGPTAADLGERQVQGAELGLAHNLGGLGGVACVTILGTQR